MLFYKVVVQKLKFLNNSNIDDKFSSIADACLLLNNYTPAIRYGVSQPITKEEISEVLEALILIYNFELIKNIRQKFHKTEGFMVLPEIENLLIKLI